MADTTYLPSSNVRVFPFSNFRPTHFNDSLLNEHNLTSLINLFSDKDSFVIGYDSNTKIIKFVIKGYYFECTIDGNLPSPLYANIQIVNEQLVGSDTGSEFQGLHFSNSAITSDGYTSLKLFDEDGNVVNKLKYDAYRLYNLDTILNNYLTTDTADAKYATIEQVTELSNYVNNLKPESEYIYSNTKNS